ncbi:MAG: citrate synthase [Coriobacteriales bacterium]|nr:citrate synthase [Coriobacteriales bacterium]
MASHFPEIRPESREALIQRYIERNTIDPALFEQYGVKRGLRNSDGTGVVVGITKISNVHGYLVSEGDKYPIEGELTYRGYNIKDLVREVEETDRFGFEEICYLLLVGKRPSEKGLKLFQESIGVSRDLPEHFIGDYIMKPPTRNIMNLLERSIANLYSYDENPESTAPEHELQVAISLLSRLPRIAVLGYYAKRSYYDNESMIIHQYIPGQSTAETILSMLRANREFTHEEARMLDTMLMIHAEHGGGNNSTFTCRCLTSSGTDPYSAYAGAIGSLKGPLHGGANIKVSEMFEDIKANVSNWDDDGEVADYIRKIVNKEAFDRQGLVYGMGHAVYTLSDPRADICRERARRLAAGTEFEPEFALLEKVADMSPKIIGKSKHTSKLICPNIDMFSGLVYRMLGIPEDLFTPLFACARMAGWSAHRFEELTSGKRIMRPAYKAIDAESDENE